MKGDREAILGRIAEALRVPAPAHHHTAPAHHPSAPAPAHPRGTPAAHHSSAAEPRAQSVTSPFREWMPPVGDSLAEQEALFAQLCAVLKTEFHRCPSLQAAAEKLAVLAAEAGWKSLALHHGELTEAIAAHLPSSLALLRVEVGYDRDAMEACDAGLTECESLVAQTGSICVSSLSSGGRTLSVLPPHHVVIARRDQLVPDLLSAYAHLAEKYRKNYPSFIGFISGPSRTGDIERILVLGAHGPKRLTVLLVD